MNAAMNTLKSCLTSGLRFTIFFQLGFSTLFLGQKYKCLVWLEPQRPNDYEYLFLFYIVNNFPEIWPHLAIICKAMLTNLKKVDFKIDINFKLKSNT